MRKEKWIKKRQRPSKGQEWRESQGLYKSVMQSPDIKAMNNWSDAETGFPGAPTQKQINERKVMIQLAQDIFDAAQLVKRAQNIEK